ncbi:MAG: threonine synthase [Syntrophorhabdaceae bacterium]|nr:threonine synthase [Syntrophorhabdaceae bacterium]
MGKMLYYSTNDHLERVDFETALLKGMAPNYGLYMIPRDEIPRIPIEQIEAMRNKTYGEIAFDVLSPYLLSEVPASDLKRLLDDAYHPEKIPTPVDHVTGKTYIMWLTKGPTYSFKDYAARFFGRILDYFLKKRGVNRVVIVATSGDTGGAVADALYGLESIKNVVFFPKGSISEGQRRQMTTLGGNVYAFQVNGDFDVCQALAKQILGDKAYAERVFGDPERFTSANSISLGRLLPQAVYPFYAYTRVEYAPEGLVCSIPSGNFGDMMGTVIAKQMGLPIKKIICGVNENTEFPDFLETGVYTVRPSRKSPSSAMIVSHPSNLARLIDFYGGHMYDRRDEKTGQVVEPGIIDIMPDMDEMRRDIFSVGITNPEHYETIRDVYERYGVILDPHGAVGWKALEIFLRGRHDTPSVVYETADPAKFPEDVKKAIGITPPITEGMKRQASMKERIFTIDGEPDVNRKGMFLSERQIREAKDKLGEILR